MASTAIEKGASGHESGVGAQFIDGELRAAGVAVFATIDPATGKKARLYHEAGPQEVADAVAAAKQALSGPWADYSAAERAEVLRKASHRINERFREFLEAEILDTGKPVGLASKLDIPRGAANLEFFADLASMAIGEAFPTKTPTGDSAFNYTLRKPRGVIAVVSPWNLPLLLSTWKIGPALACGNTVVLKPSEETPGSALLLAEVFAEVGLPKGVFNIVNGRGANSTGEWLTKHPDVAGITFTGETVTGTAIMKAAADNVRPISFELGGKNAAIVFADADLDAAVEGLTRAAFANCGQVCLGTERIYVERSVFDTFVSKLADAAKGLKPGNPWSEETTLGPLISAEHRDKVLDYYKLAEEEGATVITGGGVPEMGANFRDGFWIEPTIWTGLSEESRIVKEEIFGPCCHIAPFDNEEEVVEKANASEYGLTASVWTQNLNRAHRLANSIEVGTVWINAWFLRDLRAAFGGSKKSGIGREGGLHGLDFYTEQRNVCLQL